MNTLPKLIYPYLSNEPFGQKIVEESSSTITTRNIYDNNMYNISPAFLSSYISPQSPFSSFGLSCPDDDLWNDPQFDDVDAQTKRHLFMLQRIFKEHTPEALKGVLERHGGDVLASIQAILRSHAYQQQVYEACKNLFMFSEDLPSDPLRANMDYSSASLQACNLNKEVEEFAISNNSLELSQQHLNPSLHTDLNPPPYIPQEHLFRCVTPTPFCMGESNSSPISNISGTPINLGLTALHQSTPIQVCPVRGNSASTVEYSSSIRSSGSTPTDQSFQEFSSPIHESKPPFMMIDRCPSLSPQCSNTNIVAGTKRKRTYSNCSANSECVGKRQCGGYDLMMNQCFLDVSSDTDSIVSPYDEQQNS